MKICIDPGHGGSSSGAAGKRSLEKDINLQLSLKLRDRLAKSGIQIIMTRTTDVYLDLQPRCDIANKNKCDYFISIHCNSFSDPNVSGTETFYFKGSKGSMDLAESIQNAAAAYNKNNNRGIKTAEFYVIKYTDMPAVLHEAAFISNDKEEQMLIDGDWQDGYTKTIAVAICNYLGIAPNVEDILYRVYQDNIQIGVYKVKSNALKIAEETLAEITSGNLKVIASNGEVIFNKTKQPEVPEHPGNTKHTITDLRRASPEQMESFVHRINPSAPYLAKLYTNIGLAEGIRGDIAYAQAIKETNYFRFTGSVKPGQNNFAGLGSTGSGVQGASFASLEEGVRAHIQHLKAYANTEPLSTSLVDSRFNLVRRGSAPNFEDLNGRWAVPGEGYGESIINIWRQILDEQVPLDMKIPEDNTSSDAFRKITEKKTIEEFEKAVKSLSEFLEKVKNIVKG